jgi:hypothetical protein
VSLDLDTSRALRTPTDRRHLIEAIRDADQQETEPDYIEWKSTVDLSTKRWKAEIARQVLGFSNRDPQVAARNFEGCAYLLLGVEPGNLCGVKPIDMAELEDGVSPYVGNGPQWDPHYEIVEGGASVLVITVEPPRQGDPPFRLRREFSFTDDQGNQVHWQSGDTFIRKRGKTVRATAADLDILDRRHLAQPKRPQQLPVALSPQDDNPIVLSSIDLTEEARRAWIEAERQMLLSPIRSMENSSAEEKTVFTVADERSAEAYVSQVEAYLEKAEAHLLAELRLRAVDREIGKIVLKLSNESEDNLNEVRVELTLSYDGIVAAFDKIDLIELEEAVGDFPRRPAIWGRSQRVARLAGVLGGFRPTPILPNVSLPPKGWVDNSSSAQIFYPRRDMRPLHQYEFDPVYIIIDQSHAGQTLKADWMATARNVSGIARGQLTLRVADKALEPRAVMD